MRFGGVNATVGSDVQINWTADPVDVTEGGGYLMYAYDQPSDFFLIDAPYIKGTSKIFQLTNPSTNDNWLLRINPGKIRNGLELDSVFNPSGQYRIEFTGFQRDGTLIPDGTADPQLHGTNTLQTQNSSPTNLSSFKRGVPNQEYLIIAGDTNTTVVNGNFANGFVTTDGNNIAAGTWSSLKCVWLNDRLYEISRTAA
jgi:hypothetical protein